MNLIANNTLFVFGLFIGMLLLLAVGRRLGQKELKATHDATLKGTGTAQSAVFGLLGLLIAFTFSGAANRFEARRFLITDETNAIGTAYLRIDLIAQATQADMREVFRRYTDTRIAFYNDLADAKAHQKNLATTAQLQNEIWQKALTSSKHPESAVDATKLLIPALNQMFDITTTQEAATQNHPPTVIFGLLALLSLVSALLVGIELAQNHGPAWLHRFIFAGTLAVTMFVVLDIEFPRQGLIRIDQADQLLIALRASMN